MGATGDASTQEADARQLTAAAVFMGLTGAALLLVVPQRDGEVASPSGDGDWMPGLLLMLAPLLCAGITRSVASSHLLRPVGSIAVVLSALAAAVHVGVGIDGVGAIGWAYAVPAIVTPLLLFAAVRKGPVPPDEDEDDLFLLSAVDADADDVGGPPLDVLGPLRSARAHAAKSVLAWATAGTLLAVTAVPVLRALGWPEVATELHGTVVDTSEVEDGTAVDFRASDGGRTVRWQNVFEDSEWEVGDPIDAVLDEDGNVHGESQFGLAGPALLMPMLLFGVFALGAVRRLWGLVVACWDVQRGSDQPRLGYAAIIDDPAPKTWRPLLAVWWEDPTRHRRLPKPDAVYRGDDETSADLESTASAVDIRRAWVDTGSWAGAKPRWIGIEGGVAVPHRRMILGRGYVHRVTRRSRNLPPEPLRHGPPDPSQTVISQTSYDTHRLGGMIAWRVAGAAVALGLSFLLLLDSGGEPAQIDEEFVNG